MGVTKKTLTALSIYSHQLTIHGFFNTIHRNTEKTIPGNLEHITVN